MGNFTCTLSSVKDSLESRVCVGPSCCEFKIRGKWRELNGTWDIREEWSGYVGGGGMAIVALLKSWSGT